MSDGKQIVRWGLVGCGDIAERRIAPAICDLSGCRLEGVVRTHYELAREFAERFNVDKCYRTLDEMLSDEDIDAVYIATPNDLHCPQTIAAAKAGKHVLCEKPMALNVDECDQMISVCRENNVKLGVAYYRHFYPVIKRIKEILSSGRIGKPVQAQINAFGSFDLKPGDKRYWFVTKKHTGGGPMMDIGCHRIEVLINIFGHIKSVFGFASDVLLGLEVEDTATAVLQFTSGPYAILNVTNAVNQSCDSFDIYCTKGSIHIERLNAGHLILKVDGKEHRESYPPCSNLHQPLIKDFAQAVLQDRSPLVNAKIGREVNRIEHEIYNGIKFTKE